ncbi:MAG: murein biosynthesis integral membrane protein MurJ [Lentisphaeria bacterium]|nr:murein biosynthesis integral membrane protein MurJ [Lentisphaeria bacterium]
MSSVASTILKKAFSMAGATFASRILGLVREILMAAVLGGGTLASAWTFAFKIPNLFRRIFGEGLLGTVLVPLIAGTLEKQGREEASRRFSTVFIYTTLLLSFCCVVVSAAAMIGEHFAVREHLKLACRILPLLMPYCIFICLIGIMTSVLNATRVFFLPALLSLLLNLCLIGALLGICPFFTGRSLPVLTALGGAVLLSGILEGGLMLLVMKHQGLMPRWKKAYFRDTGILKEVWTLALPGLLGALAYQISVLTDTLLASFVSSYAVASLSYSERLVYLPIGVFAVSFGTVSLSEMSHIAERKEYKEMISVLFASLRSLLFVTLPLSVYFFFCAEDVIRAVYCRGAFGEKAVAETLLALQYYVLGIPFFAMLKVVLTAFYARKDMKTPMLISIVSMALNLVLNLILMQFLRQGGLALATALSALAHNVILLYILNGKVSPVPWKSFGGYFLLLTVLAAGAMLGSLRLVGMAAVPFPAHLEKYLLPLFKGGVFAVLYLAACFLFRVDEVKNTVHSILHKIRRN